MGECRQEEMNDEEIEKANRLMILFDNIRRMDDTEIVVFIHNLANYLYDRTKGDLYLIEGKEIKRLETSQERIDRAIEYIESKKQPTFRYYSLIDSEIRKILDILKGSDKG